MEHSPFPPLQNRLLTINPPPNPNALPLSNPNPHHQPLLPTPTNPQTGPLNNLPSALDPAKTYKSRRASSQVTANLTIRTLEQTTHGSLSRHLKARSEYLALKAAQVLYEAKSKREKGEKVVYTDEVQGALENYVRELRSGRERGRERKREAERVLWGYGVGRREGEGGEEKEKVLREVARVYGELVREVEEVGRDVKKLRGR
ncbi:hypothetical protein ACEPPN_008508 [Leptodophora sp. 'Broadleaf-Isolate-01']